MRTPGCSPARSRSGRRRIPVTGTQWDSSESALAQPDAATLRRARRGDQEAFAMIVRSYERLVFTYVYRLVDDRRLAEDITQDVFLNAFRGLPTFTERSAFTTWLFQIARNRVVDELRAIERRPQAVNIEDVTAPTMLEPRFEQAGADRGSVGRRSGSERRPEGGVAAQGRRRALVPGDRRLARDHALDDQVAHPQGARERSGGARGRGLRRRCAGGGLDAGTVGRAIRARGEAAPRVEAAATASPRFTGRDCGAPGPWSRMRRRHARIG